VLKRILLQVLLLAGIGVNVGFLLINLAPERPHLARRRHAKILLRASEPRAKWMMANQLGEFASNHDLDLEYVLAKDFDEAHEKLNEEAKKPTGILLADIDDEYADDLRGDGDIRPIQDGAKPEELAPAYDEYLPEAVERSKVEGKYWFVPKRAQVDVIAYLSPAIEDAFLHWEEHRKQIEAALKEANGFGLSPGTTSSSAARSRGTATTSSSRAGPGRTNRRAGPSRSPPTCRRGPNRRRRWSASGWPSAPARARTRSATWWTPSSGTG
jgi:hypothetical protein